MGIGGRRVVGWLLVAIVFALPNRLRLLIARAAYRKLNFAYRQTTPDDVRPFMRAAGNRREACRWVHRANALLEELRRTESPAITCPTLVIWPRQGRVTANLRVPKAVRLPIDGGHSLHVESPELIAAVLSKWPELLAGGETDPNALAAQLNACLQGDAD